MAWYHVVLTIFLALYGLGALFQNSCAGMIGRIVGFALLVWALNAGDFFS